MGKRVETLSICSRCAAPVLIVEEMGDDAALTDVTVECVNPDCTSNKRNG